jgi:heme/copper-type cytochrome/quinol oxidase subunit 3
MAHTADEHPHGDIHLPSPTIWPAVLGLGLGLIPIGFIFQVASGNLENEALQRALQAASPWMMGVGFVILLIGVGGWLLSNIAERAKTHAAPLGGVEASKFAMWCFLGTECIIFGGLIARALYIWMRDPSVNEHLHQPASLLIVSINTFLLLTSSLTVVLALSGIQAGNRNRLAAFLFMTALLGATFVGIQAYEYSKLFAEGITLTSSQFGSGFFILTGNHGLHVIVGVIWALIVAVNALRGGFTQEEHMGVEIFGLYWHFVDVVWIFIFTLIYLLPSGPVA